MRRYSARVALGLALLLLFAAVSALRWLRVASSGIGTTAGSDEVSAYEARYREMRTDIGPVARVGYLADPVPADLPRAESRNHFKRYVLTQYAMAPVLVVRSTDAELVIGNFQASAPLDTLASLQLTLIRDYGDGLMLFRKP